MKWRIDSSCNSSLAIRHKQHKISAESDTDTHLEPIKEHLSVFSQLIEHDLKAGFAKRHYGKDVEVVHYIWVLVILTIHTRGCLAKML